MQALRGVFPAVTRFQARSFTLPRYIGGRRRLFTSQKEPESEEKLQIKVEDSKKDAKKVDAPEELQRLKESYLLLMADMENLRARMRKEVQSAGQYAVSRLAKDVISIVDVLEMALKLPSSSTSNPSLDGKVENKIENSNHDSKNYIMDNKGEDCGASGGDANSTGKSETRDELKEGIRMTMEEALRVLARHGVKPIEAMGKKFDPNCHEALYELVVADVEAGTIVAQAKRGYILHDRILRPAQVGVSKSSD